MLRELFFTRNKFTLTNDLKANESTIETAAHFFSVLVFEAVKRGDNAFIDFIFNETFKGNLYTAIISELKEGLSDKDKAPAIADKLFPHAIEYLSLHLNKRQIASLDINETQPVTDELYKKMDGAIGFDKRISLLIPIANTANFDELLKQKHVYQNVHPLILDSDYNPITDNDAGASILFGFNFESPHSKGDVVTLPQQIVSNPLYYALNKINRSTLKNKLKYTTKVDFERQFELDRCQAEILLKEPMLYAVSVQCMSMSFSELGANIPNHSYIYAKLCTLQAECINEHFDELINGLEQPDLRDPASTLNWAVSRMSGLSDKMPVGFYGSAIENTALFLNTTNEDEVLKRNALSRLECSLVKSNVYIQTHLAVSRLAQQALAQNSNERLSSFLHLMACMDYLSDYSDANAVSDYSAINSLFLSVCDQIDNRSIIKRYVSCLSHYAVADLIGRDNFPLQLLSDVVLQKHDQSIFFTDLNVFINSESLARLMATAEVKSPGFCQPIINDMFNFKHVDNEKAQSYFYRQINTAKLDALNIAVADGNESMDFLESRMSL